MILLDRQGEEYFKEKPSRFVRAFLLAWLVGNPHEFEQTIEKASHEATVKTTLLPFADGSSFPRPALVVTDIHPGPFYPAFCKRFSFPLC